MTSIKTETVKSKRASMKQTEQIRDKRAFLEGRRQEAFGATDSWFYAGVKASEDWQALTAHPTPAVADFSDAYHGAREDLAIWKKRALEAEELNRKFIADINGQTFMGEPAPAVAQEPVGFRYKTRSIKYPENGWSGWHFQEGVPANYHLTDDGNFEFLTRLLYDHSTPDVALTEVLRELVEALNDFSNYVHAEQSSTDGHVQYSNTQIIRLAFKARSALKSAKEHGL